MITQRYSEALDSHEENYSESSKLVKGQTKNSEMLLARHSSTGNQSVWRMHHENKEQSQNDLMHRLLKNLH